MPELPDLTVFAENLHRRFAGKTVKTIECHSDKRLNATPEELGTAAAGKILQRVERWGKEVEFTFADGTRLLVHLMLAGRFVVTERPGGLRDRIVTIAFEDGPALVVTDLKSMARIALNPKETEVPDALEAGADYLRRKAAQKTRTLAKAFLIDQAVLRGIGNAYADEILWEARISPKAAVGRIPGEIIDELAAAIRKVLTEATEKIKAGNPGIIGGEIRDFLLVHNPARAQSPTGHPILREKIASKTTYYTQEQVEY